MVIPEKLLKLSEKELQKVLSKNIYKSKYVIRNNRVFEILAKEQKFIVTENEVKEVNCWTDPGEFFKNSLPFTTNNIREVKSKTLLDKSTVEARIKYLSTALGNVMDEEYFNISNDGEYIAVITHYPEITITNSTEHKHIMKDVYIQYYFTSYGEFKLLDMYIARTTFSYAEYKSEYVFSHSDSSSFGSYSSSFCFGDKTPTAIAISKLKKETVLGFSSFLYLFREYLGWESQEGRPYKNIDDIKAPNMFNTSYSIYWFEDKIALITKVIDSLPKLKYHYGLIDNKFTIKLDSATIDAIDDLLTTEDTDNFLLVNGVSSIEKEEKAASGSVSDSSIEFKGKIVPIVIEPYVMEIEKYPMRVHRNLLNLVVLAIEKQLEEFIVTKKL